MAYAQNDPTLDAIGDAAGDDPGAPGDQQLLQSARQARKWSVEIKAARKWLERYARQARECERQFIDNSFSTESSGTVETFAGKVNLFWSNVQVVLSAIYGRLPKAEVNRKFNDFDDDVARVAGIMMQRILNGDIERESDDTSAAMRDAVQDRFVSGLGQVWARYEVETETTPQAVIDPATGMAQVDPQTMEPILQPVESVSWEEAEVDYVYWDDFLYSPCRRWRECRWVARRVYMSQPKLQQRFKLSKDQLDMIPMTQRVDADSQGDRQDDVLKATPYKQAAVWEIWCKDSNCVYWFVEGCMFILDQQEDPLELDDFFPCPQPVVATTLTKAFIPRPDYIMAKDLYRELDRINSKLSFLTRAVKATGVYDKNALPLKNLLNSGGENQLFPVDNWSAFSERGGLKGAADWMPIDQYVNAIVNLNQRKAQLQSDLYEVLGISDIMRGASVASETATAQQLKVQYGGARLSNLQNEVARFVSGVMRIRANIICNVFQPQTIIERSQIMSTPDAPLAQQAVQLLKSFGTAMFRIDVTSDTLAAPDWESEKSARTEFMGAVSNYLMGAGPMVQQMPEIAPFLMKLLQWGAAGFKGAKTIEGVLDDAARQLQQKAQQPPPPPQPTPEDQKNLAQAKKFGAEADRTAKEAALMPQPVPMGTALAAHGLPPGAGADMPGGHPDVSLIPPGGQQIDGAPFRPLPAAPGTVAPLQPMPLRPMPGPMQ